MEVFASEHFVEAWQPWSCASVPVRFGGHAIGAVDITSPWTARNASLLVTAEALAHAIEAQLEAAATLRQSEALLGVARDAARARDDLLTVLSHEVKTPLTPLRIKVQHAQRLLARAVEGVDPDELAHALRGADHHVERLVSFVDDVLEAARLDEPPRLGVDRTELGAVVRGVVARSREDLARQGCQVTVSVRSEVVGRWDGPRLEHAVKNLLVNAMKYAPGAIEVEVAADDVHARVLVRDHGPGIPAGDRERVFLPHERAVSCRNVAGFGLGLTVVRRIVEAHGGTIRLESTPGTGSTFVIELPLHDGGDEAAPPRARRVHPART